MNRSKVVWGVICLLIAGGLAVANLRLPPENIRFQIGDYNMPWVPPVVLAIVGIVLLATSNQIESQKAEVAFEVDQSKVALNKRLESIAWGCFLIMLGGFLLVPDEIIKGGWWSIGVGVIMLGLNATRYFNGLRMSGFTTFLGILSVIGGILTLVGVPNMEGALLLIILGGYLLARPWFEKRQLFGKAEQS